MLRLLLEASHWGSSIEYPQRLFFFFFFFVIFFLREVGLRERERERERERVSGKMTVCSGIYYKTILGSHFFKT